MSRKLGLVFVAAWAFVAGWLVASLYKGFPPKARAVPSVVTVHRQFPDGTYDRTPLRVVRVVYVGGYTEEFSPADGEKPLWSVSFDKSVTYYGSPVK